MSRYAVKVRVEGKDQKYYIEARSKMSADNKAWKLMLKLKGDRYMVFPVA